MSRKVMTDLAIQISANAAELKKGVNEANRSLSTIQKNTSNISKSITNSFKAMGGALLGAFAATAVLRGIKDTLFGLGQMADRLLDLAQITGTSTDKLQEWQYVTRIAGVPTETFSNAVEMLTQRLARGGEESKTLRKGLEALGISIKDSSGELRNAGDLTEEMVLQLADMQDITKRNVIGAQLFGGSWKDLAPILALGSEKIKEARLEAYELGAVLSGDALNAANDFRIESEKLKTTWEGIRNELGVEVIPVMTELTRSISDMFRAFKPSDMGNFERWTRIIMAMSTKGVLRFNKSDLARPVIDAADLKRAKDRNARMTEEERILDILAKSTERLEQIETDLVDARKNNDIIRIGTLNLEKENLENLIKLNEELKKETGDIKVPLGEALGLYEQIDQQLKEINEKIKSAKTETELIDLSILKQELEESKAELQKNVEEAAKLRRYLNFLTGEENIIPVKMQTIPLEPFAIQTPEIPVLETKPITIFDNSITAVEALNNALKETVSTLDYVYMGTDLVNGAFNSLFGDAQGGFKGVITMLMQVVQGLLAQAIAAMIAKESYKGLLGLVTATVGVSALMALWKTKVPEFASGALVYGDTLARVGEYPGARNNPEVIAPLDKLKSLIAGENMMGGEVKFRIEGDALVGILDSYNRKKIYF